MRFYQVEITDSFSCSFLGHRSENWTKNMLSPAEAKFLGKSTTAVMAVQKLIPQTTVIQPLTDVCLWSSNGHAVITEHLSAKRLGYFNHEKALCHSCCGQQS